MNRSTLPAIALALLLPARPWAATDQKVISIEGCGSVQSQPGYLQSAFGQVNDALAPNQEQTLIYLCDANLPDTATGLDSVTLEYIGGYEAAPPWMVAYFDVRAEGYGGAQYEWVEEIGRCYGETTPGAIDVPGQFPPIELCQTTTGLSWAAAPQAALAQRLSVFFLVFAPSSDLSAPYDIYGPEWWNAVPWNYVFRLIVQYEQ